MSESKWKVGKTYQIASGSEAIITEEHGGRLFGRRLSNGVWFGCDWNSATGRHLPDGVMCSSDLLPPPAPRIKRTLWLGLGANLDIGGYASWVAASSGNIRPLTACVRIELDIPEGYGVDHDMPPILVRAD